MPGRKSKTNCCTHQAKLSSHADRERLRHQRFIKLIDEIVQGIDSSYGHYSKPEKLRIIWLYFRLLAYEVSKYHNKSLNGFSDYECFLFEPPGKLPLPQKIQEEVEKRAAEKREKLLAKEKTKAKSKPHPSAKRSTGKVVKEKIDVKDLILSSSRRTLKTKISSTTKNEIGKTATVMKLRKKGPHIIHVDAINKQDGAENADNYTLADKSCSSQSSCTDIIETDSLSSGLVISLEDTHAEAADISELNKNIALNNLAMSAWSADICAESTELHAEHSLKLQSNENTQCLKFDNNTANFLPVLGDLENVDTVSAGNNLNGPTSNIIQNYISLSELQITQVLEVSGEHFSDLEISLENGNAYLLPKLDENTVDTLKDGGQYRMVNTAENGGCFNPDIGVFGNDVILETNMDDINDVRSLDALKVEPDSRNDDSCHVFQLPNHNDVNIFQSKGDLNYDSKSVEPSMDSSSQLVDMHVFPWKYSNSRNAEDGALAHHANDDAMDECSLIPQQPCMVNDDSVVMGNKSTFLFSNDTC